MVQRSVQMVDMGEGEAMRVELVLKCGRIVPFFSHYNTMDDFQAGLVQDLIDGTMIVHDTKGTFVRVSEIAAGYEDKENLTSKHK
jgi:hypothetical protein